MANPAYPNPDTSLENPHQSSTTHSPTKAAQDETNHASQDGLIQPPPPPPPQPDASRSQLPTSLLVPQQPLDGSALAPPVRDSYLLEPSLSDRISENFLLTISLLLLSLFWLIILISQSYVTSTLSNVFIRTGWFGFVIQTTFILLTTYYLLFTTYLPPYHIQSSTLASLSIVFGVITIDQNLSIGLGQTGGVSSAQNAVVAGWFLTVFLNLFWVFYFTSPPGAPLVSFVHSIRPASRGAGTSSTPKPPAVGGGLEAAYGSQAPQIEMAPVSATIRSGTGSSSRLNPSASHLGSGVGGGGGGGALTPHQHIQARLSGISAVTSEGGGTNTPKRRSGWSFYGRDKDKDKNGEKEKGATGNAYGEGPSGVGSEGGHAVHGGATKLTKGPSVKGKQPDGGVSSPVAAPTPAQEAELGLEGLPKAEALFTYTAAPADPNELSFRKGDILYIADHSGKWWDAKRADGKGGIVPSNYLRFIE